MEGSSPLAAQRREPLGFWGYWWEAIKLALRGVPGHSQTLILFLFILAGLLGAAFPLLRWAVSFVGGVDLASWQTALIAMAAVFGVRIVLAPYWLYKDLHKKWGGPAAEREERAIVAQEAHVEELRLQRRQREEENDPLHRAFVAKRERETRILLGLSLTNS